jgi:hypothetical protein
MTTTNVLKVAFFSSKVPISKYGKNRQIAAQLSVCSLSLRIVLLTVTALAVLWKIQQLVGFACKVKKTMGKKADHFKLGLLLHSVGTACFDLSTVFAAPNSHGLPLHCKLQQGSK